MKARDDLMVYGLHTSQQTTLTSKGLPNSTAVEEFVVGLLAKVLCNPTLVFAQH